MHDAPTWDAPVHTLLTPPSKWPTGKCLNCVLCMPCTAATCGACHRSTMISRMCSCSFMAMTFVVLVLWLSADSTQILNDLLLQCACVNRVVVCTFAFSAMDASIWYQFCGHCAMFAFLDWVCQGIVIWHTLYCTFAAVEYNPQFDTIVQQTPVLCGMALNLTCMMHPHEMHLLTPFWLLPQNGWQVQAWIVYCTHHGLHQHEEHAIGSVMISRMCNLWLE